MAGIRMRDAGGVLRTITQIRMRDAGGVLRTIQKVRMRDAANVLRTVFTAFSAAASPTSASVTGSTSSLTTGTVTATPTGGTGPYTYLWVDEGLFIDSVQRVSPTSATTAFKRLGCVSGETYQGSFYCQVTDSLGNVAVTSSVDVSITRT